MIKYVSEIITEEEIKSWDNGIYGVHYGTGTGKTVWINNVLKKYTQENNKKLLYLSPRTMITKQVKDNNNFGEFMINYEYMTIQNMLHEYINNGVNRFEEFDYIVIDEYHSMVADIEFNQDMIILYDLINQYKDSKVIVLVSATRLTNIFKFTKEFPNDYTKYSFNIQHRIDLLESYSTDKELYDKIDYVYNHTQDNLFIYVNNVKIIERLKECYKGDVSVYGSKYNNNLKHLLNIQHDPLNGDEVYIDDNHRILISTKAIDSGVSFKDERLKHIFVWETDITQIYQIISRKRMLHNEDTVNIYLRDYTIGELNYRYRNYKQLIDQMEMFEEDKPRWFIENRRGRTNSNLFISDFNGKIIINPLLRYQINHHIFNYNNISKIGFLEAVERAFQVSIIDASKLTIISELDNLYNKYGGRKLFKGEQEEIKDILKNNKKLKYKGRYYGINSINNYFEYHELSYHIISKKYWGSTNRGQTYWLITVKS